MRAHSRERGGFTLIEVIAALVIFAVGVLVAAQLAGSLSVQVERAALRSQVVARAQTSMESMERLPYDSLTPGTTVESLTLRGRDYFCTTTVAAFQPRVRSVRVTVVPADPAVGVSQTLSSYVYGPW